jgi:hypothetical protein
VEIIGGVAYLAAGSELRSYDLLTGTFLERLALGSLPLLPAGEERAGERRAVEDAELPLSPTLSPLVPREEREENALAASGAAITGLACEGLFLYTTCLPAGRWTAAACCAPSASARAR